MTRWAIGYESRELACVRYRFVSAASNPVPVSVCVVVGEGPGICLREAVNEK